MSPERVFQTLTVTGLLAGGWLYGDYWKKTASFAEGGEELDKLRAQNVELSLKNDELANELAQARSMLSKSPLSLPEDLIAWVETDYGMVFLSPPKARMASPAAMRNAAENNLKLIHGESGLMVENIGWELIGLIPPEQRLSAQWIMLETTGVRGIFDMGNEEILLSETFDPESIPDSSVLARLLAQQLSFQNHPRKKWDTRDEWEAWQATHIGAAASLQARYNKRRSASDESPVGDPEAEREALLMNLSPAIQGLANFPFIEGNNYARNFYIQSREAWSGMFRNPATNTASIIDPEDPVESGPLLEFAQTDDEILGENSLGELGLRLWLEPYVGNQSASDLAGTWKNDRFRLTTRDGEPLLVWLVELTDEASAQALLKEIEFSMIRDFRETQPMRQIEVRREGATLVFENYPKSQ